MGARALSTQYKTHYTIQAMKVLAFLFFSVALLQFTSFSAEASPYEASFPDEVVTEAYPMESPAQDNRVLAESDFEANDVDEIVGEHKPNWEPPAEDKAKLDRLLEKWTTKPAMMSDLVQHPPAYASGTHHATFASGHHAAYSSGHPNPAHKPAAFASGAAHAPAPAPHAPATAPAPAPASHAPEPHHAPPTGNHADHEILSVISFGLEMPIDEKTFQSQKSKLEAAMAHELGLSMGEVTSFWEPFEEDPDLADLLVEELQTKNNKVKFEASAKSKDAAAAKAMQSKIEADAKRVASGGKSIDGITIPKQTPKMKVEQKTVTTIPKKKSGVSSNSVPNFVALVVVGLTAILY